MYRIGIIGTENSHAMAFSKMFHGLQEGISIPDFRVVGIYGEEPEANDKVAEVCGIDWKPARPEEMLGKVDAVMVTSRNGALHWGYAKPFIEAGLPVFVDKPIANSVEDALALAKLARASGAPITGGSSTKLVTDVQELKALHAEAAAKGEALGGSVWAPLSFVNAYGNFYFYSAHLAEIAMEIFGTYPKSVHAVERKQQVTALLVYEDFTVSCHFTDGASHYGATVLTKTAVHTRKLDISQCYSLELHEFVEMVRTGKSSITLEKLIAPVSVLNAIEKAYLSGEQQEIVYPGI